MLSTPLTAYAKAYDFDILDDCAYGTINSYLITVSNDGYKKAAFVNFFLPESDEGDTKAILNLINGIKELKIKALEDFNVSLNGVYFKTGVEISEFDEAVLDLCNYLSQVEMLPAPVCSECGYSSVDKSTCISVYNKRAVCLCEDCVEDEKAKTVSAEQQTDATPGKKSLGVLGAVLGSVIALIITLLLYAYVIPENGIKIGNENGDSIPAVALSLPFTAVISVLAFLGYRIFTKRKGTERLLPCFIISTALSIISVYLSSSIVYANSFGVNLSAAFNYKVFGTIMLSPFVDPAFRSNLLTFGLFSLAISIVVTLIYSIIFDKKAPAAPVYIPLFNFEGECDDDSNAEEEIEANVFDEDENNQE